MVVEPFVELDNAHFNVWLQVQRLEVGVHANSFLKTSERHQELGFYPYSIRLDMEPLVEGHENLRAIPIVEAPLPRPTSLNISPSWGGSQAGEAEWKKVEVVTIDNVEGGNTASFKWRILRWENNKKYDVKMPHRGVRGVQRKNGSLDAQLPFEGCAVSVESEIPDVYWRYEREMKEKAMKFRIRLQVEMHLIWWRKNLFMKSIGSLSYPFKYENVWDLHQNERQ